MLGVVVAEHAAAAGQGVFVQLAGRLILAQVPQVGGEVVRKGQGVALVVAEHAALAGQGVFVQLAGRLILAQVPQVLGEVGRRTQGGGVVVAEDAALAVRLSSFRSRASA